MIYLKNIFLILIVGLVAYSPCYAMKTSEMTENSAPAAGDWLIVTDSAYTATQMALFTSLAAVPRTFINASAGWLVESLGCHHVCQAWDTAFKTKSSNDYSRFTCKCGWKFCYC